MFKNRLELVKQLMQIMHITLILRASTGSVHFKFGFELFLTFCMSRFFYYFLFFFQGKFWGFSL